MGVIIRALGDDYTTKDCAQTGPQDITYSEANSKRPKNYPVSDAPISPVPIIRLPIINRPRNPTITPQAARAIKASHNISLGRGICSVLSLIWSLPITWLHSHKTGIRLNASQTEHGLSILAHSVNIPTKQSNQQPPITKSHDKPLN